MQVRADAVGLAVATIAEAEAFAAQGFDDFRLAYPPVGSWRLTRTTDPRREISLKVLVDAPRPVEQLERSRREAGVNIGWLCEIESGNHRFGTEPGDSTAVTITALARQPTRARFAQQTPRRVGPAQSSPRMLRR